MLLGLVAAVLGLGLLAGSCASSSTDQGSSPGTSIQASGNRNAPKPGSPRDGGKLVFGLDGESDGYNPVANNFSQSGNMVASAIYDPLVRINADRKLEPHLATVTTDDNGKTWTITARAGVTFHDGTPFNAEAIKVNIEQRKKSALSSIALEPLEGVDKVDDMTVKVRMSRPWAAYDYTLAAQGGYQVSPKALLNADGTLNPAAASNPVGTGPFTFKEWKRDSFMKLAKNPTYWQQGKPHLDELEFRIIVDATARSGALQSGDIQGMVTERPADVRKFREEPGYVQAEDLAGEEQFLMINTAKAPFDNLNARRAVAFATDQQAVIDLALEGLPPRATAPYTKAERWYVADDGWPGFDLAKAKEAVAAYTKETGQPTLTFELIVQPGGDQGPLAQILQQQYQAAGIDMKITSIEQSQVIVQAVYGRYQAVFFRNFGYVDPDSNYIFWHSSTAKGPDQLNINFPQNKDPEIDAALDKARATTDQQTRYDAYATVQKRLNQDLPFIWLNHSLWAIAAKDTVGGLDQAQAVGFGRPDAKTWWGDLYLRS